MKIQTEIIINAPAAAVWEMLTHLEAYATWNPFIVESAGQVVPAARLRNVMRQGDKTLTFRPQVLRVEPGRYFDWRGSLGIRGIFDGHHYFELVPLGPQQVKLIQGENFSGLLAGPIFKRIGAQTRSSFVAMNQALKTRVEARAKAGVGGGE